MGGSLGGPASKPGKEGKALGLVVSMGWRPHGQGQAREEARSASGLGCCG